MTRSGKVTPRVRFDAKKRVTPSSGSVHQGGISAKATIRATRRPKDTVMKARRLR